MAENKNDFNETVASLFKGMDSFLSAKTVVGEAVHVNDTIILPLVDVSFGVGAGAFAGDKKNNAGGSSIFTSPNLPVILSTTSGTISKILVTVS